MLREIGIKVTPINFPQHPYEALTSTIFGSETAIELEGFSKSERLIQLIDPHVKRDLKYYLRITATEYLRAQRMHDTIAKQVHEILNKFDAFVSPTLDNEAVKLNCNLLKIVSQKSRDYSVLGALFGLPALTMPMGFGHHGLPLGITITGKPFDENTLLQIAMLFQRETDWHRMNPKIDLKKSWENYYERH